MSTTSSSSPAAITETNCTDERLDENSDDSESEIEESISLTEDSRNNSKKLSSTGDTHFKQPLKAEEDDAIDPVMLKYMKLVEEKKKSSLTGNVKVFYTSMCRNLFICCLLNAVSGGS